MGDDTAEEKVLDVKADAWAKRQRLIIRKQPLRSNVSHLTAPTAPTAEELVALLLSQHLKESRFAICKKLIFFIFATLSPICLSVQ